MPAEPFEIEITGLERFQAAMQRLADAGHDMTPAMRMVAMTLVDEAEENFDSEGRPDWPDLAASTIAKRTKAGSWPGKKEQVSGGLAASIASEFGPTFAKVGQGKVYAAIQNLGGDAGRGHAAHLPPRPSLPITPDGGIQPEAEQAVLDEVLAYLARVVGP